MSILGVSRLAKVLPEILPLILFGKVQTARGIAAGLRLGGIFAWAAEQVQFSPKLAEPDLANGLRVSVKGWAQPPQPPLPDLAMIDILPVADTAIVAYSAVSKTGDSLRVLVSRQADREAITSDGKLIEGFISAIPRSAFQIPKDDCVRFIEDIISIALAETDLAEEANGLRLAVDSDWFEAPSIVSHKGHLLVETELAGRQLQELPEPQRRAAYCMAVITWSRMLLADGILQPGLRRDRLIVEGNRLGITRWAGTRQALPTSAALVQSLVRAAYGPTASIRISSRHRASELLADGLGLMGGLEEIEAFCLSLLSGDNSYERRRWRLSEMAVRERPGYSRWARIEVLQVLRQLIWLRDLGLKCHPDDLAAPWRELAVEVGDI